MFIHKFNWIFDFIRRELIENSNAPKHQKISAADHTQLVDLLLSKDNELKSVLKLSEEQAQIEQKMIALKAKVNLRDQQIKRLQRRLKDSEEILSRALFQARQKLASIAVANKKPVPSEELIKYAYRFVTSYFHCNRSLSSHVMLSFAGLAHRMQLVLH